MTCLVVFLDPWEEGIAYSRLANIGNALANIALANIATYLRTSLIQDLRT